MLNQARHHLLWRIATKAKEDLNEAAMATGILCPPARLRSKDAPAAWGVYQYESSGVHLLSATPLRNK